ncbi:hypothetical protein ABT215_27650 [Streptomyces sp900105755]|uniref:hypothetical protein n=1 Tax=Streptomyces sp. 900105755 TaxID=3154389 RepID=UPI00331C6A4F
MSRPKKKQPKPGEVVSRWRAVEWGEREERRFANLLFGGLPKEERDGGGCRRSPAE